MFSCSSSSTLRKSKTKHEEPFDIRNIFRSKKKKEDSKNQQITEKEKKEKYKSQNNYNSSNYQKQEMAWAEKQTFSESEKLSASISHYDFFKGKQIVKLDLDLIYHNGEFPFMGILTSNYGSRNSKYHNGVDLSARNGTSEIRALLGGVVKVSRYMNGYGNTVIIRHMNGLETLYAHNRTNKVKHGDIVTAGQVISIVGSTGRSTGPHLHFEVRVNGKPINPNFIVDPQSKTLKQGHVYIQKMSNGAIVASRDESRKSVAKSRSHTVKKGDTIYSLARKYGTSAKNLRKVNNISKNNELHIGQRLRIT